MLDVGKVIEVSFVDLTHDAMGVAKVDGYPLFVEGALKGEKALVKITKLNKKFGFAQIVELKETSPFRKQPLCSHFDDCGGCNLMHMHYDIQLSFKRHRVKETLRKIGGIDIDVNETVGMDNPFYYRNKAMIPFGSKNGRIIAGMFKRGSHEISDLNRCHIYPRFYSEIIKTLKHFFFKERVSTYDPQTRIGFLRGVMIRHSETYKQVSIVVVATSGKFPQKDALIKTLTAKFPYITSIMLNINAHDKNFRLGNKSKELYGEDAITEKILGVDYTVSHQSFFQINPIQTENLYKKAIDFLEPHTDKTVVDAYCGTGTIALSLAKKIERVIGFDQSKQAIKNAHFNAKNNHIDNVDFLVSSASKMTEILKNESLDAMVVDPPRKGLEEDFLNEIITMRIPKIVYISCNPSTLARDIKLLSKAGYQLKDITPFDMFPQTSHIESVALITRQ